MHRPRLYTRPGTCKLYEIISLPGTGKVTLSDINDGYAIEITEAEFNEGWYEYEG